MALFDTFSGSLEMPTGQSEASQTSVSKLAAVVWPAFIGFTITDQPEVDAAKALTGRWLTTRSHEARQLCAGADRPCPGAGVGRIAPPGLMQHETPSGVGMRRGLRIGGVTSE